MPKWSCLIKIEPWLSSVGMASSGFADADADFSGSSLHEEVVFSTRHLVNILVHRPSFHPAPGNDSYPMNPPIFFARRSRRL